MATALKLCITALTALNGRTEKFDRETHRFNKLRIWIQQKALTPNTEYIARLRTALHTHRAFNFGEFQHQKAPITASIPSPIPVQLTVSLR